MPLDEPGLTTPVAEAGMYIVRCATLTDGQPQRYGPTMMWGFELYDLESGEPLENDGEYVGIDAMSSTSLSISATGQVAKARQWAEALLDASIEDIPAAEVAEGVLDRWAYAAVEVNANGFSTIKSLATYNGPGAVAAANAMIKAQVTTSAPPAPSSGKAAPGARVPDAKTKAAPRAAPTAPRARAVEPGDEPFE